MFPRPLDLTPPHSALLALLSKAPLSISNTLNSVAPPPLGPRPALLSMRMDGQPEEADGQTLNVRGSAVLGRCHPPGNRLSAFGPFGGTFRFPCGPADRDRGSMLPPSFPDSVQTLSSSEEKKS